MNNGKVNYIPEGYHTITPFVLVKGAKECMDFIKQAFGGEVVDTHLHNDGSLMHGTMKIGNSLLMMSDASDRFPAMPCMLYLYMEDVDATYKKALEAGGTSLREPTNEFYGDRSAGIQDKWNNQWWIATHVEDVSPEEMQKREAEFK